MAVKSDRRIAGLYVPAFTVVCILAGLAVVGIGVWVWRANAKPPPFAASGSMVLAKSQDWTADATAGPSGCRGVGRYAALQFGAPMSVYDGAFQPKKLTAGVIDDAAVDPTGTQCVFDWSASAIPRDDTADYSYGVDSVARKGYFSGPTYPGLPSFVVDAAG